MSFAAGFGYGMGAGVGTGIAIGTSSGRQAALDELGSYLAEDGLTIHDREGEAITVEMQLSSVRGSCATSSSDPRRKVAFVVALLLGVLAAGAGCISRFCDSWRSGCVFDGSKRTRGRLEQKTKRYAPGELSDAGSRNRRAG